MTSMMQMVEAGSDERMAAIVFTYAARGDRITFDNTSINEAIRYVENCGRYGPADEAMMRLYISTVVEMDGTRHNF